jgi:inhibitor of Bruton tyrosine kinase
MLLLQRSDIDVTLKDYEGYTAFDLYNSTIEHSKPSMDLGCGYSADHMAAYTSADLFTWGVNRNAVLGSGSADDRTFPEPVLIRQLHVGDNATCVSRLAPIRVRQVVMSKLHTVVVTTEGRNNIRVCGFGSGGRLGPSQHTQYDLIPINQLPHPVSSVALGQDHTLALTKPGEVFSWGLNRFAQLGYIMEQTGDIEQVQATPKRIYGPLKHKFICGVAACKTASACFTSDELYTWGTNNGQLGGCQPRSCSRHACDTQVISRVR